TPTTYSLTPQISTLSLHDALPISDEQGVILEPTAVALHAVMRHLPQADDNVLIIGAGTIGLLTLHILHTLVPKAHISILARYPRSEEHTSELQSLRHLVCRLLLEK